MSDNEDVDDHNYHFPIHNEHDSHSSTVRAAIALRANMSNVLRYVSQDHPDVILGRTRQPCRTSRLRGHDWVGELLSGNETRIKEQLRMNKSTFRMICNMLISEGYQQDSPRRRVSVEESVAIFLTTVGLHHTQRDNAERFQHSTETIHRHVQLCAHAIASLAPEVITSPNMQMTSPEIYNNSTWYPYFKDCVGAIDGTIIPAWAPSQLHNSMCSRKGNVSQNIIAACSFDMTFSFVVVGWEGSANDSRVFLHALGQPEFNFPWPPPDKFYLVDAGFANFPGFLAPYRRQRYHLPEFQGRGRAPSTQKELFNRVHSSIRNHIERCFGIVKARFPILKGPMTNYPLDAQINLVLSCFVLHNIIRRSGEADNFFHQFSNIDMHVVDEEMEAIFGPPTNETDGRLPELTDADMASQAQLRDEIAEQLWNHFHGSHM